MSVILMTNLFYKALILQGEIWCWSLLGIKRFKIALRGSSAPDTQACLQANHYQADDKWETQLRYPLDRD